MFPMPLQPTLRPAHFVAQLEPSCQPKQNCLPEHPPAPSTSSSAMSSVSHLPLRKATGSSSKMSVSNLLTSSAVDASSPQSPTPPVGPISFPVNTQATTTSTSQSPLASALMRLRGAPHQVSVPSHPPLPPSSPFTPGVGHGTQSTLQVDTHRSSSLQVPAHFDSHSSSASDTSLDSDLPLDHYRRRTVEQNAQNPPVHPSRQRRISQPPNILPDIRHTPPQLPQAHTQQAPPAVEQARVQQTHAYPRTVSVTGETRQAAVHPLLPRDLAVPHVPVEEPFRNRLVPHPRRSMPCPGGAPTLQYTGRDGFGWNEGTHVRSTVQQRPASVAPAAPGSGTVTPVGCGSEPRPKRPWTVEEDERLRSLVPHMGIGMWAAIAQHIPGRTGKQVRERWLNHLSPTVVKRPWSPEEDRIIMETHTRYGNAWSKIAKLLDGRSDNSVKNRFYTTLRRRYYSAGVSSQAAASTHGHTVLHPMNGSVNLPLTHSSAAPSHTTSRVSEHDRPDKYDYRGKRLLDDRLVGLQPPKRRRNSLY